MEALEYVALPAGLRVRSKVDAIVLEPIPPPGARFEARFPLKPAAYARLAGPGEDLAALTRCGLVFDTDAAATYSAEKSELFVRSTEGSIEVVRALVAAVSQGPGRKRAAIEASKFEPDRFQEINRKLNTLVVPALNLDRVTPVEAMEFFRRQAFELDSKGSAASRGVNIVYLPRVGEVIPNQMPPDAPEISVRLTQIPLAPALAFVCSLMNMQFKVGPHAVMFAPIFTQTESAACQVFDVGTMEIPVTGSLTDVRAFLIEQGVPFPPSATAIYLNQCRRLVIRNTQENIDLIEILVNQNQ